MGLVLLLTAWLLILFNGTAFVLPQARARIAKQLFVKDPELNSLLQEYQKATRRVGYVPSSPTVDPPPKVDDVPPTLSAVVEVPVIQPTLEVPEPVVSQKLSVFEGVSAATPTPDKVPSLIEWLARKEDKLRVADPLLNAPPSDASNFNRVVNLNDKVAIMKQNLLSLTTGIKEVSPAEKVHVFSSERITAFAGKVTAGIASASAAASSSLDLNGIMEKLHVDQFGAWYVVIATFIWGVFQRNAGKREIEDEFREQLRKVQAQANEVVDSGTTPRPLKKTKRMPYNPDNDPNKLVLEATKTKVLQMDMEKLKSDAEKLRAQTMTLQSSLKKAEAKAAKMAVLEAKLAAAEAQLSALTKPAPAPDLPPVQTKLSIEDVDEPSPIPDVKVEAAPKTKERKASAKNVPKSTPITEPVLEVKVMESPAPTSAPKASKGEKATVKKVAKKVESVKIVEPDPAEVAPSVESSLPEPINGDQSWASLSESSLKRKTVKELTEYLATRGVTAIDENGNSLKKAQLLEAIQRLR